MPPRPFVQSCTQLEAMIDQEATAIRETINESLGAFLHARPNYAQLVEMVTRDIILYGDSYERCYIRAAAWRQFAEEVSQSRHAARSSAPGGEMRTPGVSDPS